MRFIIAFLFLLIQTVLFSQYNFTHTTEIECTEVKNQSKTGTCWSFATSSFIESELMKAGKGKHDLSEMFVVRNIYRDKARNYILRQGKANFSQGSLAHDVIRIIAREGVMPEDAYSGLINGAKSHNHSEMVAGLKGFLDGILSQKRLSQNWDDAFEGILDAYLGNLDNTFTYQNKVMSPKKLAKSLELDASDYVSISSFTHHPFYEEFILEIPDNYSNGSFYNVRLNEIMEIIDNALNEGYTIAWDGDVSEKGFNAKMGIAVLPKDSNRKDLFDTPGKELVVDQELRQTHFESYSTTDDHLMHIVGRAEDQNGTKYYIVKNSWGEISPYKGYLYMSEAYMKMKTVAIMINKNAMPTKFNPEGTK